MRRWIYRVILIVIWGVTGCGALAACDQLPPALQTALPPAGQSIPGRPTPTPPVEAPGGGSDVCLAVFPLEQLETVDFDRATPAQLEAAFGAAQVTSGRPTRLRFDRQGCTMLVTLGGQTLQAIELLDYGTLGMVVGRYGPPETAGIAQGNLALPLAGISVLLYPSAGIIVMTETPFNALSVSSPVQRLILMPPFDAAGQVTRLNLQPQPWQPLALPDQDRAQ